MVEKAGETNVEPLRLHTHGSVELEVDSGGQMAGTEAAEALMTFAWDSVRWGWAGVIEKQTQQVTGKVKQGPDSHNSSFSS